MESRNSAMPLVSICMPVYNAEKYLAEALDSCLNQSYPNTEIICVNDGSTDESLRVLKSYRDNIRFLDVPNGGAQVARNLAFKESRGEYINFFDADNRMMPDKIAIQIEPLLENKADMVFANRARQNDTDHIDYPESLPDVAGHDPFCYCLEYNTPGGRASIDTDIPLHRRSFIEKVNGFRLGVVRGQDKDMAFRLAAAGARFHYIDQHLTIYRDHDGPRISDIKKSNRFNVDYFVSLAETLLSNPIYQLSKEARQQLATKLVNIAKAAYRSGEREAAKAGFDWALKVYDKGDIRESMPYRLVRQAIGYPNAEKLYDLLK